MVLASIGNLLTIDSEPYWYLVDAAKWNCHTASSSPGTVTKRK